MVIVVWYIFSLRNSSLVTITTSKPVSDIALVAAILTVGIAIGCESLFAVWTLIFVYRFSIYFIQVCIPPFISASVRTELLYLSAGVLLYFYTTALTETFVCAFYLVCHCPTKSVSATICLYRVLRQLHLLCYFFVPKACCP